MQNHEGNSDSKKTTCARRENVEKKNKTAGKICIEAHEKSVWMFIWNQWKSSPAGDGGMDVCEVQLD